ncbi:MAG TPA: hypothetical protein VLI41_08260 [Phenylobacterium sp.]|uniref:hypothetical protein n=1 Tax=Phenylobacterium sp. TaxID=1871053 RepID=UPI002BFC6D7E|nr:hypothetical protein [Phenylobacterium sp.]HSV03185.1 hypothetical protein [Phenylobacterium sp.]
MPDRPNNDNEEKRAFRKGSSGPTADEAPDRLVKPEDRHVEAPHSRPAKPLAQDEKHDQLAEKEAAAEDRQEALLDEAIEETFPGSDPISPKHIT